MNQNNITGGSAIADGDSKISSPSIMADTGVRADSAIDRISGLLTAGGADAPTDVARAFDTVAGDSFGSLSPSRVGDAAAPFFGQPGPTGIFDIVQSAVAAVVPGVGVQGAGLASLLTGRNILVAGGLGVLVWYFLLRKK